MNLNFAIEPFGQRPRPLTSAEFDHEVQICVLESAAMAEKHGHVWLHSLQLAYAGWNRPGTRAFEQEVFGKLGISSRQEHHADDDDENSSE